MMNRRTVTIGLVTLPLLGALLGLPAFAQTTPQKLEGDIISTPEGDLVIHPVSHASLVLGWGGHVIYVDPVGGAELYEGLPRPTGILITHEHSDHFDVPTLEALAGDKVPLLVSATVGEGLPEALKARAKIIANGENGSISGINVNAIAAYNITADRLQYHPKGRGNGYVLNFGDVRLYIAGDTEDTEEMRALTNINVAFLPMNLPYTMTPEQAAEAVKAFKPKIVYPYHFRDTDPQKLVELLKGETDVDVRVRDWYAAPAK